jgi:membrane associated rhomboid family serine protease
MGIYSRDYLRDAEPGSPYGGAAQLWAIKFLLIANVAVFVLQNMVPGATEVLSLNLHDLSSFQVWRLLTYGFCHATQSLSHLLFNMLALWMFGRAVEPIYGSREFLGFYLVGIFLSGLAHVAVQAVTQSGAGVIGASGGVMAVVFLTAMHFPRMTVLLFFIIPIELRWLAVLYAVADTLGMFQGESSVAHAAHLAGAAFGVLYQRNHWHVTGWWDRVKGLARLPRRGGRPKVRIFNPERDARDLDEQVDAILAKISEHGEASLTDREREILSEASRRYRKR